MANAFESLYDRITKLPNLPEQIGGQVGEFNSQIAALKNEAEEAKQYVVGFAATSLVFQGILATCSALMVYLTWKKCFGGPAPRSFNTGRRRWGSNPRRHKRGRRR